MSEEEKKVRPIIAARERGPGPGRYGLPATVGYSTHDPTKKKAPAYSFGARLENTMFKKDCSPGPGYFIDPRINRTGRDGTPSYSILGRQKDGKAIQTPAPGAYSPEKVHPQGERHAPAYSMAMRTRYRKRDSTPAANVYTIPQFLGSRIPTKMNSASFSMTGRSKTGGFSEDLAKAPGPGAYQHVRPDVTKRKAPGYSMLGRSYMPGDSTMKPGPGAYSPEMVLVNNRRLPSYSLGIRHSEYITPLIVEVE